MTVILSDSVGAGGANGDADVRAVQAALQEASRLTLDDRLHPGPVDGDCGDGTEGAIERFQRRLGTGSADARIDPGGYTLRRLNALLAIAGAPMSFPFDEQSAFAFVGPGAGMRSFGWRRPNGRAHAGIDLYFPDFTPILALAEGKVTRGPYAFYNATYAVEIDHGAFLARYGEIAPESTWKVSEGDPVTRGQVVGRVGILKNADGSRFDVVPSMMLHLELYDKTETGKLTRAPGSSGRSLDGRSFRRRRDLIDPSGFVARAPLP
jgi:hypothetical protein